MPSLRALACPASLKGVLSARDAAAALAAGLRRAGVDAAELPVADGGEGTLDAVPGGELHEVAARDAFGRPRRALIR
ncbi:MAG: glycerate kinase, partial [Acidobacteriota bacterium]|nr:glycerate kinase [Acidobacteriota bacterium]